MDVKIYRLLSGEEVIGYVEKEMTGYVILGKPHVMVLQQNQEGKPVLMFAPLMICTMSEGSAKLYFSAISAEPVKVPEPIEKGFRNQTSLIQQVTPQDKSLILGAK
jgi:hypothetical protein